MADPTSIKHSVSTLKSPYADYILLPRVQPEVVRFWCQMKAHIFLIIIPKFQPQIHHTLEVIAENVPISGIPIFIYRKF